MKARLPMKELNLTAFSLKVTAFTGIMAAFSPKVPPS